MDPPIGERLPVAGFTVENLGYQEPELSSRDTNIVIGVDSNRLQILKRFDPWNGNDIMGLNLLIKTKGKCTTDHISMAGPWLQYRGHLENISKNLLMGATNAFNDKVNLVKNI